MAGQKERQADLEKQTELQQAALDEKEIEIRHQYQMFPTPDEKFASEVITELKD
ncbi:hypothetical protein P4V54_26230 [Brevibacillus nitrificans]|uniref:hypothetical protein n=1 Tax=Brevibacillus nitrificans TaxID=651560 RepID=UPI002E21CE2A|nr:hypothetical protein [Brevibacillus nitrificans]